MHPGHEPTAEERPAVLASRTHGLAWHGRRTKDEHWQRMRHGASSHETQGRRIPPEVARQPDTGFCFGYVQCRYTDTLPSGRLCTADDALYALQRLQRT